jgi:hypothetical protein
MKPGYFLPSLVHTYFKYFLFMLKDHIVRKIFSKFKKTNTSNDLTCLLPDLERGLDTGNTTPRGSTLLLSPTKGRTTHGVLLQSFTTVTECEGSMTKSCITCYRDIMIALNEYYLIT